MVQAINLRKGKTSLSYMGNRPKQGRIPETSMAERRPSAAMPLRVARKAASNSSVEGSRP